MDSESSLGLTVRGAKIDTKRIAGHFRRLATGKQVVCVGTIQKQPFV